MERTDNSAEDDSEDEIWPSLPPLVFTTYLKSIATLAEKGTWRFLKNICRIVLDGQHVCKTELS